MKLVIGNPKTGKSYQMETNEAQDKTLIGKKIAEQIEGHAYGLAGYTLQITGGTDKQGFPMRQDVHGSTRKSILVGPSTGMQKSKRKGYRRRKTILGNTITENMAQINLKVTIAGDKDIDAILGKKQDEQKEESNSS